MEGGSSVPIGLDVAFGVLGNTQVAPEIAAYILGGSDPIRDGLPYQHNLAAVKATLDQQGRRPGRKSIYSRWLFALRNLSAPTTDPRFPQAMRTRAWAMKTVNTQLASWTQLRHDTVLYAAQPYSGIILCEYPAGYIEPGSSFGRAMRRMAQATAETMDKFTLVDGKSWEYAEWTTCVGFLVRTKGGAGRPLPELCRSDGTSPRPGDTGIGRPAV